MAKNDISWVVTRIDGKIASVGTDFRQLPKVSEYVASLPVASVSKITVSKIGMDELAELSLATRWEDLRLIGTAFQIKVWKQLFTLTHSDSKTGMKLMSYSELAQMCDNPKGVRAVAHAVASNPIAYIIPCHLIIPKESIDRILQISTVAQGTIFKGTDLYLLDSIDVGEYEYGSDLKRLVIEKQLYSR